MIARHIAIFPRFDFNPSSLYHSSVVAISMTKLVYFICNASEGRAGVIGLGPYRAISGPVAVTDKALLF